jgi:regulator of ribonuclease activity A
MVSTLKVFEDNSLVRAALEAPGQGRVLVVDGGGSMRCALLGDVLSTLAMNNGWSGVVVNGCIRDSVIIKDIDIGIMALGTNPRKSVKRWVGGQDMPVNFGDVIIDSGDYLYADEDGVMISSEDISGDTAGDAGDNAGDAEDAAGDTEDT